MAQRDRRSLVEWQLAQQRAGPVARVRRFSGRKSAASIGCEPDPRFGTARAPHTVQEAMACDADHPWPIVHRRSALGQILGDRQHDLLHQVFGERPISTGHAGEIPPRMVIGHVIERPELCLGLRRQFCCHAYIHIPRSTTKVVIPSVGLNLRLRHLQFGPLFSTLLARWRVGP